MSNSDTSKSPTPHVLPPLPYAVNALEPVITAHTIGFHYGKHHQGYVDNLNKLVAETEYAAMSLEKIVSATAGRVETAAIFNNAAQIWNHTFYWKSMRANGGGEPPIALKEKWRQLSAASTPAKRSWSARPFPSSGVVGPG